ncbi:hypothetical protein BHMPCIPO_00528 [Ensifer sesbaniae]|nr:hypothetical protein [Ensifer sesbaniae]
MNTSFVMPVPTAKSVIIGRVLSGVLVAFLVFDAAIKLVPLQVVTETMVALGYPADQGLARLLGVLTLLCTLLYVFPRTSILGAILLTGYLGGAMATHLRAGSPLFTHLLFGFYLGVVAWAACGSETRGCAT